MDNILYSDFIFFQMAMRLKTFLISVLHSHTQVSIKGYALASRWGISWIPV